MTIFAILLFLFFLLLKSTDIIDWNFWWITAPLWGWLILGMCQGFEAVFRDAFNKAKEK